MIEKVTRTSPPSRQSLYFVHLVSSTLVDAHVSVLSFSRKSVATRMCNGDFQQHARAMMIWCRLTSSVRIYARSEFMWSPSPLSLFASLCVERFPPTIFVPSTCPFWDFPLGSSLSPASCSSSGIRYEFTRSGGDL
jgi:hypothetical protein